MALGWKLRPVLAAFSLVITIVMSTALLVSAVSMDILRLAIESRQYLLIHPLLGKVFWVHHLWDVLIFIIILSHALSLLGLAMFFTLRARS